MQFPRLRGASGHIAGRIALFSFLLLAIALSILALAKYPGTSLAFVAFTTLGNALLLNGFRRKAIFFETFIGIFFWLGFFLKLAIRVAFMGGQFWEEVGAFDGSGHAFDQALNVASVAFAALLVASFLRQRFWTYPEDVPDCSHSGLYLLYCRHRRSVLIGFVGLVTLVAVSNIWLGIYQRGMIARTVLPFGLNGLYKWWLQFGLASISALVVRFEIARTATLSNSAIIIPLLESFLCNVSLLSRGMILNVTALAIGAVRLLRAGKARLTVPRIAAASLAFVILFGLSVLSVNYLRALSRLDSSVFASQTDAAKAAKQAGTMSAVLFIDRWVGMEGLMAVTSAPNLGWELWNEAWREKYKEGQMSLYDAQFINSPYKDLDRPDVFHFVSLPGLVAFLFYTGSTVFVFFAMLTLSLAAAFLEMTCFRWCGKNLILCSLFAQVIAFRFSSFGYVPAQSYLLFGTLLFNGLFIAGADIAMSRWYARKAMVARDDSRSVC